jgi:hypothetical protein
LTSRNRKVLLIAAFTLGVLVSVAALMVLWESNRECVRWSTRIDVNQSGKVRRTQVCAESQPRQRGDELPFDPRVPKEK